MDYYVIIPAHNEESYLGQTLNSLLQQSLVPKKIVVVNDNSDDGTERILDEFTSKHGLISKLNTKSSGEHMPGSKVINAFNKGLLLIDQEYDFIVKLDADIILPKSYFEKIAFVFKGRPQIGIAGGFAFEQDKQGDWKLNHPMNKDHVRGAFKAYSKKCFIAIGGLKNAMGWDTVDELLAQFHGYEIYTDETLEVKHLRPTGKAYNAKARHLQGQAMYRMRYGFCITLIASLKMALKQQKRAVFIDNMHGYFKAKKENQPFMVSNEVGVFIRELRWKNIKRKLIP